MLKFRVKYSDNKNLWTLPRTLEKVVQINKEDYEKKGFVAICRKLPEGSLLHSVRTVKSRKKKVS